MRRLLSTLLGIAICCWSFNWMPSSTSSRLANAALGHYLSEMKTSFDWTPPVLLVKSEELQALQLQQKIGQTQILIKNQQQLLEYSLQHTGKTLLFVTLEIEQEEQAYSVYIVNEGLKTTLQQGAPSHQLTAAPLGRACVLRYDHQFNYQGIDCLLLPEDETP